MHLPVPSLPLERWDRREHWGLDTLAEPGAEGMGCWGPTDTAAGCNLAVAVDMDLGSREDLAEGAVHNSRCGPVG